MNEMITQMQMSTVSEESLQLISEIEEAHQQLSSLSSTEILQRSTVLYEYRKKSSSTLQKGHPVSPEQDTWAQANLFVSKKISENIIPTWQDILTLHQILEPQENGQLRTSSVFIGQHEAVSAEELPTLVEVFKNEVLLFNPNIHPLISACRARYWLVTLHPFLDGNGRTSNLLCDWILALHNYPPLTFRLKVDSHIGGWSGRSHFSDLDYACIKTLNSLKYTYELLLKKP